jgi:hypothetical protein
MGAEVPDCVEQARASYVRAAQRALGKKRFSAERERGRALGWETLVDGVDKREPARVA